MDSNNDLIMRNSVFAWIALGTGVLLMIPLVAMQFTEEVNWDISDFVIMGIMLFGFSSLFVLVSRKVARRRRLIAGSICLLAFLYLWAELAVGIFAESQYAGQEHRQIKSLSDKEIRSLENGDGMGFAKLAELNRYPGPRHVLELASELELSPEQVAATEALFAEMKANAKDIGKQLLQAEMALDHAFAEGNIDDSSLHSALLRIGELRAQLRYTHLEAHLRQTSILSEDQIAAYDRARGYRHEGHTTAGDVARHEEDKLRLFAVEVTVGPNWDTAKAPNEQAYFKEHSENLKQLRDAGHIVMGARYSDIGLVIFSAESADGVRAFMERDPSMNAGTFKYEVHPFNAFYPGTISRK